MTDIKQIEAKIEGAAHDQRCKSDVINEDWNSYWDFKKGAHFILPQLTEAQQRIKELEAQLEYANETVLDLLTQAIGQWDKTLQKHTYDHMCMSTYESAVDYAVKNGLIKHEQVGR